MTKFQRSVTSKSLLLRSSGFPHTLHTYRDQMKFFSVEFMPFLLPFLFGEKRDGLGKGNLQKKVKTILPLEIISV